MHKPIWTPELTSTVDRKVETAGVSHPPGCPIVDYEAQLLMLEDQSRLRGAMARGQELPLKRSYTIHTRLTERHYAEVLRRLEQQQEGEDEAR